ncbi:MAG: hypothetical protein OXF27_12480 [Acidobacteria bacterium]|nr:hypothetical protein [Acidobacteriota bacterium]
MDAGAWKAAAVLAFATCGMPGCSGESEPPADPVELTVSHRSEWRVLWLEGETNLPDGAHLNYRVTHEAANSIPVAEWPATNLMDAGRSAVKDGAYWARINTFNWPPGMVRVVVQFPLPPQPPDVVERYGELGERLSGEHVTDVGGTKAIELEHVFEHRR